MSLGQLYGKEAAGVVVPPMCTLPMYQRISSGLCFPAVLLRGIIRDDLALWGVVRAKGR